MQVSASDILVFICVLAVAFYFNHTKSPLESNAKVEDLKSNQNDLNGTQYEIHLTTNIQQEHISFKEEADLLALATLIAPEHRSSSIRAPVDIAVVIDKSGSMLGEKIALVRKSLEFLVQQLNDQDRLSIVAFDYASYTLFPTQKMTEYAKKKAEQVIRKISAEGGTNLSGGLTRGLSELASISDSESSNKISSVLLFTDGQANAGITDPREIVYSIINQYNSKIKNPYTIYTFGYGKDHSSHLLSQIAEARHGLYYFIEKASDIPATFADCIGGLLSVAAQEIMMTISPLNGVEIQDVITGYTFNSYMDNGIRKYTINIGDLYSGETRNVIFKLKVPSLSDHSQENYEVANISIQYSNVINKSNQNAHSILKVLRPETTPANQKVPKELELQVNRMKTAEALKTARKYADSGNFQMATDEIDRLHASITVSSFEMSTSETTTTTQQDIEYNQHLLDDLEEAKLGMNNKDEYIQVTQKKMMSKEQSHSQERSNSKDSSYGTNAKATMVSQVEMK